MLSSPQTPPSAPLQAASPKPTLLKPATQASQPVIEVLKGGFETTIQDYPGREGYLQLGIPRSGPMDPKSFQLGNQLLENPSHAAGLEIQFLGPELKFLCTTAIALSGANNRPQLNQQSIPMWTTIVVQAGDILSFGHARSGARTYVHFAGGLDVPMVMGSRSTFTKAQLGGLEGRKLEPSDRLASFGTEASKTPRPIHQIPPLQRPTFCRQWNIEILLGPHDDWLSEQDIQTFIQTHWKVSSKSDRMGYRLEGPEDFEFAPSAHHKSPDNGDHPSNKIDYGCHLGTMLFCGQTPTILMVDSPSLTGYMAPFTVCQASLWKVGQARPGDSFRFHMIDQAAALRRLRNS